MYTVPYMCFALSWLNHIIFSVLCFRNICLLLLIFIVYQYSCYSCSIVYICKYCVCPHGPYGLLDVGIKVSMYIIIQIRKSYCTHLWSVQPPLTVPTREVYNRHLMYPLVKFTAATYCTHSWSVQPPLTSYISSEVLDCV